MTTAKTLLGLLIAVVGLAVYLASFIFEVPVLFWVALVLTPIMLIILVILTGGGGGQQGVEV